MFHDVTEPKRNLCSVENAWGSRAEMTPAGRPAWETGHLRQSRAGRRGAEHWCPVTITLRSAPWLPTTAVVRALPAVQTKGQDSSAPSGLPPGASRTADRSIMDAAGTPTPKRLPTGTQGDPQAGSSCRALHGAAGAAFQPGSWLPPEEMTRSCKALHGLVWVAHCRLCTVYGSQRQPDSEWKRATGHEHQRWDQEATAGRGGGCHRS